MGGFRASSGVMVRGISCRINARNVMPNIQCGLQGAHLYASISLLLFILYAGRIDGIGMHSLTGTEDSRTARFQTP